MAGSAVVDKRNPDNKTAPQIVAEFEENLLPGQVIVAAMVTEIARLQLDGFALVNIPNKPPVGPWNP